MADSLSSPDASWRSAVAVREDPELAALLSRRLPPPSAPRAVSVTDLVAPRRAFWRAVAPVSPEPERRRRMGVGRLLHRRLGVVLSHEGALEVRVRRDGVVGRIDLLSDVPVEVKTSSSTVSADRLRESRPDQVEQLAMYCALTDRTSGRLVTIVPGEGAAPRVQAVDLGFGEVGNVREEMGRRARALRAAWAGRRASDLPACRWFGRGCEFQAAEACDCTGAETSPAAILSEVRTVSERTDISDRIASRLAAAPSSLESPTLGRFRDLLYPRRAYFERTEAEPRPEPPRPALSEPADLYARLAEAVESGPLGEVTRLPARSEEPEEEVGGFRGAPYLVRTSRGRDRLSAETLLTAQPQYALELGFRCVATGVGTARLIAGRERASDDAGRVQAFEITIAPAAAFAREWRERARQLATARSTGAPGALPPCPGWMYDGCPYASACDCGDSGTRSQR